MALIDRDIIITPNRGAATEPNIKFIGADASSSGTITLRVLNTGTMASLSFEGSTGQLFSLSDTFTGTIFSVNDVSGIPSIEVIDTGEIRMAQYSGFVDILSPTNATSTGTGALQVVGGVGIGRDVWIGGSLNVSGGITASVSGTISTATTVTVTDDASNASAHYPTFVAATSGNQSVKVDSTGFIWIPSSNRLGIGGSPTSHLHIQGSANDATVLDADHTGFGGRHVRLPGRVVIGPHSSAYPGIYYNAVPTNAGGWNYIANDTAYRIDLGNSNRITLAYAAAGTGAITWTDGFILNNAGNVSIGTTGGDYSRTWRLVIRQDQNATTQFGVINANTGASAVARISKITGTSNSYVDWNLHDNSGTPYDNFDYGSAVTRSSWSFSGTERARLTSGGDLSWGSSLSRTLTKDDAGTIASKSGFFESASPVNYYSGASSWQHMIEARHSNDSNNYAMQIAGSFFDQNFYGRKTNNTTSTSWFKFLTSVTTTDSVQFGSLGIGTPASGTTGEIRATNEITAYYSDRRLKDNVVVIGNAVEKVNKLQGITYTPNELAEKFGYDVNKKLVGLFADEVESVLPEAVRAAPFDLDENGNSKSGENYKTIQYEKIVPLLVEAIKEQQRTIDQILSELKNLATK